MRLPNICSIIFKIFSQPQDQPLDCRGHQMSYCTGVQVEFAAVHGRRMMVVYDDLGKNKNPSPMYDEGK